jgi:hypothetical protein
MFKYKKADGTIVSVTEAKVQEFLLAYPDATIIEESIEPGKPTSQGAGAPVAETAAPEIQLTDTASPQVSGSLDSQIPTQTKSSTNLVENGKAYRPEDIIEYEKAYATFQENRDSELRKITLKIMIK